MSACVIYSDRVSFEKRLCKCVFDPQQDVLKYCFVTLAFLQGWKPPFAVDMDKFQFTPRIQPLNELEVSQMFGYYVQLAYRCVLRRL